MAATPVTPIPGLVSQTPGGTPVTVVAGGPNGGFIVNPASNSESIFVDPVTAATAAVGPTCFEIVPGQSWEIIPGQTTPTSVNSVNPLSFSVVSY